MGRVRNYTSGIGVLSEDLLTNRARDNFISGNDVAGSDVFGNDCFEGTFNAPAPTVANSWYHNRGTVNVLPAGICR